MIELLSKMQYRELDRLVRVAAFHLQIARWLLLFPTYIRREAASWMHILGLSHPSPPHLPAALLISPGS